MKLRQLMLLTLLPGLGLTGCAYTLFNARPPLGLTWEYSAKKVAEDTYRIQAREDRFGTVNQVEDLFRLAANKVAETYGCKDYRILSQSRYYESAAFGAVQPMIEGDILCLKS